MKFYIEIYFNRTPQGMEVEDAATLGNLRELESQATTFLQIPIMR